MKPSLKYLISATVLLTHISIYPVCAHVADEAVDKAEKIFNQDSAREFKYQVSPYQTTVRMEFSSPQAPQDALQMLKDNIKEYAPSADVRIQLFYKDLLAPNVSGKTLSEANLIPVSGGAIGIHPEDHHNASVVFYSIKDSSSLDNLKRYNDAIKDAGLDKTLLQSGKDLLNTSITGIRYTATLQGKKV